MGQQHQEPRPPRPRSVTPTLEPGSTSIIVSWDPPADNGSDITHYLIRYAENLTGNEQYSADIRVNAPATRTRITGLQVGVPYVVQVQAVNAIGAGPNPAGEIQTTTGLIPDAPTSVRAVPTPNGNGSTLTVTWNRVTRTNGAGPVSSYIVETLDVTNPGNAWVPTLGIDGTTTKAVVHVVIGRTYLVRVKAVALHTGSSGYIDTPVKAAGSPATPALLAATIATDGVTVNVIWTAVSQGTPSDITSYVVSWFSTTDPGYSAPEAPCSSPATPAGPTPYAAFPPEQLASTPCKSWQPTTSATAPPAPPTYPSPPPHKPPPSISSEPEVYGSKTLEL